MKKVFKTLDVFKATAIYLYTGIFPDINKHPGSISFHFPITAKVFEANQAYDSGIEVVANRFAQAIKYFNS